MIQEYGAKFHPYKTHSARSNAIVCKSVCQFEIVAMLCKRTTCWLRKLSQRTETRLELCTAVFEPLNAVRPFLSGVLTMSSQSVHSSNLPAGAEHCYTPGVDWLKYLPVNLFLDIWRCRGARPDLSLGPVNQGLSASTQEPPSQRALVATGRALCSLQHAAVPPISCALTHKLEGPKLVVTAESLSSSACSCAVRSSNS